jgi:hypothetical protein
MTRPTHIIAYSFVFFLFGAVLSAQYIYRILDISKRGINTTEDNLNIMYYIAFLLVAIYFMYDAVVVWRAYN